jgi:HSP20 family protein
MRLTPALRRTDAAPANTFANVPRIFDEFFRDWPFHALDFDRSETWRPAVDVLEKDGNLVLRAEVPGISEKDIDLKLEGNVLTLKGERKHEAENDNGKYYRKETCYGTFSRSFSLPDTVDIDKIKADYRNGVLTVTIPQKPEVAPRAIPVSVN